MLNLKGAVVTIDSMGTQRAIAETIVAKGGDYLQNFNFNKIHRFAIAIVGNLVEFLQS